MKLLFKILGLAIGCSPLGSLWCFEYYSLKQKARALPTVKDFVDREKKTASNHKTRLMRLSDDIESGTMREVIMDLHDEGCLLDLYTELTGNTAWVANSDRTIIFKVAFAVLDSFLECRNNARATYVEIAQRMDMISAEILRVSDEIRDLEVEELSFDQTLKNQQTKYLQRTNALNKALEKNASLNEESALDCLLISNRERQETYTTVTSSTQAFITALTAHLSCIKETLEKKKDTLTRLLADKITYELESTEKMAKLALWDEQIVHIGLSFKGTLSPALMIDLLEEYLTMKKLSSSHLVMDSTKTKDDFEKIKAILDEIKQKTVTS